MSSFTSKSKENREVRPTKQQDKAITTQFEDNRVGTAMQSNLAKAINRSSRQLAQRKELSVQFGSAVQLQADHTGLPENLKSGIENLSGYSMDDVKVHFNSDKPSQLQAHAYAQGTDIHVASGQEKHLPHEAWHVVQQKQGRVKPTLQMKGKVNVNNDTELEKEADTMGAKALQMKTYNGSVSISSGIKSSDLNDWGTVRGKLGGIAKGKAADSSIASEVNESLSALGLATGSSMSAHMIPNRIGGLGDDTNVRPWDRAFETGTWETDVEKKFNQKLVDANKGDSVDYKVTTTDMTDKGVQEIIDKSTVTSVEKEKPEHKTRIKKIPLAVSANVGGDTLGQTDECYKNLVK